MSKVNVPIALLSLTISVLMWASIYNEENRKPAKPVQKVVNAPLTPTNLDRRKYVLTDIPVDYPLSFAGTQEELQKIQPSAIVDLSGVNPGSNQRQVLVFPTSIRNLMTSQQALVNFRIEALVTKEVEIRGNLTGVLPDGKRVDGLDVFPKRIVVAGLAADVNRVDHVQASIEASAALAAAEGVDAEARPVDSAGKLVSRVLVSLERNPEYSSEALELPIKIRVRARFESDSSPTGPLKLP